jgi:ketosteroid isomerase-like protein
LEDAPRKGNEEEMAEDLRKRIHLIYAAFAAGNLGVVDDAFDDDVDFASHAPAEVFPYLGRCKGKRAVKASLISLHEEFEILKFDPVSIIAEHDDAALIVDAQVRHRETGRQLDVLLAHFLRFRDGRITEYRAFMDSLSAVKQMGRASPA